MIEFDSNNRSTSLIIHITFETTLSCLSADWTKLRLYLSPFKFLILSYSSNREVEYNAYIFLRFERFKVSYFKALYFETHFCKC